MSQRLSQIPTDAGSECFYRASGLVRWPYSAGEAKLI
jgi:hypothetical protein